MKKIITYWRYLFEYLRYGDFISVISAIKYVKNRASHSSDRIIKTSVGIFFCRKNTNDFQFANYYYEWNVKKFILDHIREYKVFIDGGSCIGSYSILLSKFNIRCIAFEPIAENFSALLRNLELNKLSDKVDAYQFGLGNEKKQASFKFNAVNTGASFFDKEGGSFSFQCQIRTFDSLVEELKLERNEKILFKLDLEGMETEALQGAADFIRQYANITFIIEYKHSGIDNVITLLNTLADFEIGIVDQYNIYARKIRNLK
ncbi:MAG: FkbM family methyltransferase [Bacteroidota bacterium]